MITKSEYEIKKNWHDTDSVPMVTIRCTAYNHEKYIERALDSFLEQDTTFPFEILVHDDASTDCTAEIIRRYEELYPNIVKPIYEKENQYSKKDGSLRRIMDRATYGKYVALCEGDDYWCDPKKLQRQWEFMEQHPDCSMCVHNSYFRYLDQKGNDKTFNQWKELHRLTPEDVFFGWFVHTSSYFYNNKYDFYPAFRARYCSGDYAQLTLALQYGEVYCLPEVMSVYNAGNQAGITALNNSRGYEYHLNTIRSRITYLNEYDKYSNGKFHTIVKARIAEDTMKISETMEELVSAAKDMVKSTYYTNVLLKQDGLARIKTIWKYQGYLCGHLWLFSVKMRHRQKKRQLENKK